MADSQNFLEIRDVAKRFNSVVALKSAALSVRPGEVHALMGANGAGKSTLVKIITGVFPGDGGTVAVRGDVKSFRSPAEARRAGIVSVYQDPALVPDLTVAQNMRLAQVDLEAVRKWLIELGITDFDETVYVRDLPLPILRLIDLARALSSEPDILLLDEITAALPADLSERVFSMVRRWRSLGHSVIFISHRMAEVSALCDRATVLRDGTTVGVVEPAKGGEDEIVSLMLGTEVAKMAASASVRRPSGAPLRGDQPALEVTGLRYGMALSNVSFNLYPGEVLGVAALEGQGQEQLFDCLAGMRQPDGGSIVSFGKEMHFSHPADAIRAGMVLVPANRLHGLLQQRSIRENVALPAFRGIRGWGPVRMRAEKARVGDAVKRLQIDTRAESQLRQLSGGNQQKVVIARWIANGFKTLLCFDPTRGIDVGTKRQIYTLVREVAQAGASVLLFTSELPEIPLACDRAIVLFGGRIVGEMPAAEADEERLLRAAHGLVSQSEARA